MSSPPPSGIYTPLVAFFNPDESLDLPSIRSHALRIAKGGVAGLVIHGSNGEAVHLSNEERTIVIREVREVLDDNGFKQVVIIAGAGAPSQRATIIIAQEAKEAGAGWVLVLPPSYWPGAMTRPVRISSFKSNHQVLLDFFRGVADASPLPVLVYNFPMVANGINIDSDLMLELAQHPNIVGCKLTCGVSWRKAWADARTSAICIASHITHRPRSLRSSREKPSSPCMDS